ncbi:hypothetical protein H6P81_015261 [Aristolochia fimbriata]|uniref:Fanconi anemia group I protein n=1 Tax=Aristolochia fimbriata TaxID=158543 RepID=A0AAV7E7V8_ARIFI|nr:hypothetical protein H6P81_015261 [Aristolochia fimbriata]
MAATTAKRQPPVAEADIVRLVETGSPLPAVLLASANHSTLLSLLHSPPPSFSVVQYLSSLLNLISHSASLDESLSSLLSSLLSSFLALFVSRNVPRDQDSVKIFQLFSLHLPSLPKNHIPPIVDTIVSYLPDIVHSDDVQPLDLLPQLLDLVRSSEEIDGNMDYVDSTIDGILRANWSKALLVKFVHLIREFPPLDKTRSKDFLEKVFLGMKGVDLQDLPSLVYQLLVLASKGFCKKRVIEGIITFFRTRTESAVARQIEGTVLLHVNFAVKQDPSLAQELLSLVRSDLRAFNHFTVAVLLSVARVRRFSDSAIGVLKTAVVTAYREHRLARDCKWIPDSVKGECLQTVKGVEKAVMRAINESNFGREHILPSVVQFGFALLESLEGRNSEDCSNSNGLMGSKDLGVQILKTTFEDHHMARKEIIERCKFHILSAKPQQGMLFVKLLGHLIQSYPYPMLEYVGQIKELLEYFTFMHERISTSLITALVPLIKFSRDLRDYTILVVRKAMFRKEESVRAAATNAIIDIILTGKGSSSSDMSFLQDSSSQASSSQQCHVPYEAGTDLFHQMNGLLRRCLSQQARVKEIVYRGLLKIALLNPLIVGSIFDLLWPHFCRFYHEDEDVQLRISSCVKLDNGKVCLEEPLECLLSCVSWILLLQQQQNNDQPSEFSKTCFGFSLSQENQIGRFVSTESFSKALVSIQKFLQSGSTKDVSAKCLDSHTEAAEAEMNHCHIWVWSGIIEVVINLVAKELEKAPDAEKEACEKEIIGLVSLHEYLQKSTHSTKHGKAVPKCSLKATSQHTLDKSEHCIKDGLHSLPPKFSQVRGTPFATSSIYQLLFCALKLYKDASANVLVESQGHSQSSISKKLGPAARMISFSLKACHHHLKSFTSNGSDEQLNTLIYGDVKVIARPLLELVLLLRTQSAVEGDRRRKEVKGKKTVNEKEEHIYLALMCLHELFKMSLHGNNMHSLIKDLLSGFPRDCCLEKDFIGDGDENVELVEMIDDPYVRDMHLFLGKIVKPLLSELLSLSLFRGSEVLSEIVLMIGNKLPCNLMNFHGVWAFTLCRNTLGNPKAARSVVSLVVYLQSSPNDLSGAQEMSMELLKVIGSEDTDPVENSDTYPIINLATANTIASLLLKLVESTLVDLDWAITKLRTLSSADNEISDAATNNNFAEKSPGLRLEEALYGRSEGLVDMLSHFAEMNLKDPLSEQLLKLVGKFYKCLARMTKLRIAPKGCKQLLPGNKFQRLAEVTCKKLTAPLYNFMAMVQRNQQENTQGRGIAKKIQRENKCIPDLIFQIEDYEKYLINLSKVTKINLLRCAKRSTARDFKILGPQKPTREEEEQNGDPNPGNSAEPHDECSEDSEGDKVGESPEAVSPRHSNEANADDSSSESEDQEMIVRSKRAKMSSIVEDSDEEG